MILEQDPDPICGSEMCDLALSVSGGMSPQRDNFSAKTAAPAMPVGDLIMANH
jgi:hypothetical protein